ncbi:type III secretion system LcrG-like protein [Pseudomonas baetica]|uniref:Type III secretion protein LcrG n=2 Tax=Pseudomonas fluorescens group TaxID=136843 RepID=A0A423LIH4_PSEFL|nr:MULTISPECIES: LcrG family type III secretion system chaperone [Pseudomonas fluorescens group]MDR9860958.1 LcrG family type III secretion system chaperone [Pseudomonas baetica]PKA70718.1 type III secretion system LcrG-like protein [Pseudomonas baetica]PTC16759.1 type III secretion protein LcrG [Pseudomonas baetica]RON68120.1 type III secretion protein LcrG [Pseudomonas fluorescens]
MSDETYAATVQASALAIEDSEHRARLLSEMWQGLGLPDEIRDQLFQSPDKPLVQAAEQELLKEVQRMRANRPPVAEEGKRLRRPASMRGLQV